MTHFEDLIRICICSEGSPGYQCRTSVLRVTFELILSLEEGREREASVVQEILIGESGEDKKRGNKKSGRGGVLPEGDFISKAKSQKRTQ